jgi:hypothetical protein
MPERCGLVGAEGFMLRFKRMSSRPTLAATYRGRVHSQEQKSSPSAPRNAPLRTGHKPGAETALFL